MSTPTPSEALARRLRELREARGLSQDAVAAHMGFSDRVQVSNIETGRRRVLAVEVSRFARLFNVPVGVLLGDLGDEQRAKAGRRE